MKLRAEAGDEPSLQASAPPPPLRIELVDEADPLLDPTPPFLPEPFEVVTVAPNEPDSLVYLGPKTMSALRFRDKGFRKRVVKKGMDKEAYDKAWTSAWEYEGLKSPGEWVPSPVRTPCMGDEPAYWTPQP